jgi:4-oxalocrotonate tautomerase
MPMIRIACWEGFSDEQKKQWISKLTDVTVDHFNLPPDKVLVVLNDVPLVNGGQTGVTANHPDFLVRSRLTEKIPLL